MKTKVSLLLITAIALVAMAVVMSGCGSKKEKTTVKPGDAPTNKVIQNGDGVNYVEDNIPTISPIEKTTDKKGNTVVTYTNGDGNKVTRTEYKNGKVHLVIKDKKGKVIKDKTYKRKEASTTAAPKKDTKKDSKKDSKKEDKKDKDKKKSGDDDGWSDFY